MPQSSVVQNISESLDIFEGRRVLDLEASALSQLSEALDESFIHAIDILQSAKGRVIVTGMGKSGHIARKIAATLSSTGTPSFFVHPAEASHGDLGMISSQDVLIALSNSGETSELAHVIHFATRLNIPLIAITKKGTSALAQAAQVVLTLPDAKEACPIGLAPTTSTTLMIALGDALAAALLLRKGFSSQDFSQLHPGGTLGQHLKKVSEIMHKDDQIPLVDSNALMSEAIVIMTSKSFGCVGVLDEKQCLIGLVTDGDLRRHMDKDLLQAKVCDVMTPHPKTIRSNAIVAEAVHMMNANGITSLFVVDPDKSNSPLGIIHIHDCLRIGER